MEELSFDVTHIEACGSPISSRKMHNNSSRSILDTTAMLEDILLNKTLSTIRRSPLRKRPSHREHSEVAN